MFSIYWNNLSAIFLTVFSLVVSSTTLTSEVAADTFVKAPHHGSHGMLMFGGSDGLFASHLPMYHPPHNAQVVFRFHFSDEKIDTLVKSSLEQAADKADQVWTILPEPFDLMRLDSTHQSALKYLTVSVTEGHFERGGNLRFTNAAVVIEEILTFRRLDTKTYIPSRKAQWSYCAVSSSLNSANQFLVKRLGHRPEADHIVRLSGFERLSRGCFDVDSHGDAASTLFASDTQLLEALSRGNLPVKPIAGVLTPLRVKTLYLEIDELK